MSPSHPARRLRFLFETEAVDPRPLEGTSGTPPTAPTSVPRPTPVIDLDRYRIERWLRTFERFARERRTSEQLPPTASSPGDRPKDR